MAGKTAASAAFELQAQGPEAELENKLPALPEQDPILLHPALAKTYCKNVVALSGCLNQEPSRSETSELLRGLLSEGLLHSGESAEDGHVIELIGELTAILELTALETTKSAVLGAD